MRAWSADFIQGHERPISDVRCGFVFGLICNFASANADFRTMGGIGSHSRLGTDSCFSYGVLGAGELGVL